MRDLILLALPEEAPNLIKLYKNVHTIGVGKVSSAINAMWLITLFKADRVINLGTAGAITAGPGIHRINQVVQHDVNLTPLGLEPGQQFNDPLSWIHLGGEGLCCASGDIFVTEPKKLRIPCDIVEMEAYSIARAAKTAGIEVEIWKYITDNADAESTQSWQDKVAQGERHYIEILEQLNVTLEPT
jgi:adenosylhomocysteine nucleosidase